MIDILKMDWDKLKTFYYVAQEASFSRASVVLNTSQSALSRSIATLEERTQLKLFERVSRGVILTEEGNKLFQTVKIIIESLQSYAKVQQDLQAETQGIIDIGVSALLPLSFMARHTAQFLKAFPKMRVQLQTYVDAKASASPLQEVTVRPADREASSLTQVLPLGTLQPALYASEDYLKRFGMPTTPQFLIDHRLLTQGPLQTSLFATLLPKAKLLQSSRNSFMTINSYEGLIEAARAGLGIVPLYREFKTLAPDLKPVLPHLLLPPQPFSYVYPRALHTAKRITAYGDFLQQLWRGL